MEPLYYQDQSAWTPREWYALYRYLDRLFSSTRGTREEELAALNPSRMSVETKYLIFHLVALQGDEAGWYGRRLNFRSILEDGVKGRLVLPHPPLILQDPAKHAFAYFKRNNIWL